MNQPVLWLERPQVLLLLAVPALLLVLELAAAVKRLQAERAFVPAARPLLRPLLPEVWPLLRVLSLVLLVIALAGPRMARGEERRDVVVVLDVSQSMAVQDVEPSRLIAARRVIDHLASSLQGVRLGLVFFAGKALVRFPITDEPHLISQVLDVSGRPFVPSAGSSLRAGMEAALGLFTAETRDTAASKTIVLLTDGEDPSEDLSWLEPLRERGVRVLAVGVGTPEGGPVPVYNTSGRIAFYIPRRGGGPAISRLETGRLRNIVDQTGGRLWTYTGHEPVPEEVAAEIRRLPPTEYTSDHFQVDDRLGAALAGLSLGLLLMETSLRDRRLPDRLRWTIARTMVGRWLAQGVPPGIVALALALVLGASCSDGLEGQNRAANEEFLAGRVAEALASYQRLRGLYPEVPELAFNAGTALEELGRQREAVAEFDRAIEIAGAGLQALAYYNKGIALYRDGRLEEAREAFKAVLRLDPSDRDAKFNLELLERMLAVVEPDSWEQCPDCERANGDRGAPASGPESSATTEQRSERPEDGGTQGPLADRPVGNSDEPDRARATVQAQPTPAQVYTDLRSDYRDGLPMSEALRLLDLVMAQQGGFRNLAFGAPDGLQY